MIARPKISRNEWKTAEIGAFEVWNFALFFCPVERLVQEPRREDFGPPLALAVELERDLRVDADAEVVEERHGFAVDVGGPAVEPRGRGPRPFRDARVELQVAADAAAPAEHAREVVARAQREHRERRLHERAVARRRGVEVARDPAHRAVAAADDGPEPRPRARVARRAVDRRVRGDGPAREGRQELQRVVCGAVPRQVDDLARVQRPAERAERAPALAAAALRVHEDDAEVAGVGQRLDVEDPPRRPRPVRQLVHEPLGAARRAPDGLVREPQRREGAGGAGEQRAGGHGGARPAAAGAHTRSRDLDVD